MLFPNRDRSQIVILSIYRGACMVELVSVHYCWYDRTLAELIVSVETKAL